MPHGKKLEEKDSVLCRICGRVDVSDLSIVPHHIGTRKTMVCYDCGDIPNDTGHPQASMCRNCCPTGHGTRSPILKGKFTGGYGIQSIPRDAGIFKEAQ